MKCTSNYYYEPVPTIMSNIKTKSYVSIIRYVYVINLTRSFVRLIINCIIFRFDRHKIFNNKIQCLNNINERI